MCRIPKQHHSTRSLRPSSVSLVGPSLVGPSRLLLLLGLTPPGEEDLLQPVDVLWLGEGACLQGGESAQLLLDIHPGK